jgi:hypothetical protein
LWEAPKGILSCSPTGRARPRLGSQVRHQDVLGLQDPHCWAQPGGEPSRTSMVSIRPRCSSRAGTCGF